MKLRITALAGLCLAALIVFPADAQQLKSGVANTGWVDLVPTETSVDRSSDDPRDTDLFALQVAVVRDSICLSANLRAVHHYELSYDAYIRNHRAYPDAAWIDERYPYPEPEMACVVGLDPVYGYPIPVKSVDTPVCQAQPPYVKPSPAPEGTIVFGGRVPESWDIPKLVGCYNAAGSKVPLGTEANHPTTGERCLLVRYGTALGTIPRFWCPIED